MLGVRRCRKDGRGRDSLPRPETPVDDETATAVAIDTEAKNRANSLYRVMTIYKLQKFRERTT